MALALWVLTVLAIAGIALTVVRATSDRLGSQPRVSVYDLEEAIEFVAERLPVESAGRLRYEDVRLILETRLDALEDVGVAVPDGVEFPDGPTVFVKEADVVATVLAGLEGTAYDLLDEDVALVLAFEVDYVVAIGAIGPEARDHRDQDGARARGFDGSDD